MRPCPGESPATASAARPPPRRRRKRTGPDLVLPPQSREPWRSRARLARRHGPAHLLELPRGVRPALPQPQRNSRGPGCACSVRPVGGAGDAEAAEWGRPTGWEPELRRRGAASRRPEPGSPILFTRLPKGNFVGPSSVPRSPGPGSLVRHGRRSASASGPRSPARCGASAPWTRRRWSGTPCSSRGWRCSATTKGAMRRRCFTTR